MWLEAGGVRARAQRSNGAPGSGRPRSRAAWRSRAARARARPAPPRPSSPRAAAGLRCGAALRPFEGNAQAGGEAAEADRPQTPRDAGADSNWSAQTGANAPRPPRPDQSPRSAAAAAVASGGRAALCPRRERRAADPPATRSRGRPRPPPAGAGRATSRADRRFREGRLRAPLGALEGPGSCASTTRGLDALRRPTSLPPLSLVRERPA